MKTIETMPCKNLIIKPSTQELLNTLPLFSLSLWWWVVFSRVLIGILRGEVVQTRRLKGETEWERAKRKGQSEREMFFLSQKMGGWVGAGQDFYFNGYEELFTNCILNKHYFYSEQNAATSGVKWSSCFTEHSFSAGGEEYFSQPKP